MIIIRDGRLHTEFLGYRHKRREPIKIYVGGGDSWGLHIGGKRISNCGTLADITKQKAITLDVLSVQLSAAPLREV
jgi:hypothetical protein